jgi:hypothetical protein
VQKTKSVNVHVSTTTIEEVDNNTDIPVSLYTTAQARWMVDSGATYYITPHHSDFIKWTLAQGTISLGGYAEIYQMGIGTVSI